MAKVTLDILTDIDGFVAAALADGESGLALATQGGSRKTPCSEFIKSE